ncbi:MAG: PQQ-dependent sugar dehydrogenase [Agriterribacter sp.]
MKKFLFVIMQVLLFNSFIVWAQNEPFTKRTIITGLQSAWEVVYGPNDSLWITENASYKISRISLGALPVKTVLLDLSTATNFAGSGGAQPQGGLMGLAIHPNLYNADAAIRAAKPWVYVAYVYTRASSSCPTPGSATGCVFTTKIVRYDYNGNTLSNPTIILDNIPGSSDHNSGRLVISPVIENGADAAHTQYRLYYTVGDMGAGQFANTNRPEHAQDVNVLEGKVLRLNTESDGDTGEDRWIPNDNPFYNSASITPQDYVFTLGHRNAQGLVWGYVGGNWRLYSSEQMDRADDEINIIQAAHNYGWNKVSGYCDGDINGFTVAGEITADEINSCNTISNNTEPIFTMFHSNTTWSTYPNDGTTAVDDWPTVALSSIDFYGYTAIPGWNNSLMVTPLKQDKVYRLKLNAAGTGIASGDTVSYFRGEGNRIRRITTNPTGLKFYVARDASSTANAGAIVEYTYAGVLPLKLLLFKGSLKNGSSYLQWETANEINTQNFIVEKSVDGLHFNGISTVAAHGNTSTNVSYSYTDTKTNWQLQQVLYYRLKMVDKDGKFTFSDIIIITAHSTINSVSLLPNPIINHAQLTIQSAVSTKTNYLIIDNTGRTVLQDVVYLKKGTNNLSIDFTRLSSGVYYIIVANEGMQHRLRVLKL